jgi:hypothetical protein
VLPVRYSVVKDRAFWRDWKSRADWKPAPLQTKGRQWYLEPAIAKWWAWVDLNYRPHPYQGCALAT